MAIVRWDPLKDLMTMHDRMNKIFDETLNKTAQAQWTSTASKLRSRKVCSK